MEEPAPLVDAPPPAPSSAPPRAPRVVIVEAPAPRQAPRQAPRPAPAPLRLWRDYWFGPGFSLSYAVCRVAFALAFLYMASKFYTDYDTLYLRGVNRDLYRPLGILCLVSPDVPPAALCNGLRVALQLSSVLLLVGFFTRTSYAVALFAATYLGAMDYAFAPGWSQQHSPVLLAGLALLFGPPSGYSLDALLRRALGRPAPDHGGARAAVLAGQFMIGAIFLNAAAYKIYLGNGHFMAWCYSDNLRNILLQQYWILDRPMPALLQWVVGQEWLYKGLAFANVVAQLAPVLACFLVRRPWLRLLCGALFTSEVLGLDYVMGIWNPHWLLLVALFVDWDRLAAWLTRGRATRPAAGLAPVPRRRLAQSAWIGLLLGAQLVVSFAHRDQRRWTFPLTSFPMFSTVLAQEPFNEHRPFILCGSRWRVDANIPLSEEFNEYRLFIWCPYYWLPWGQGELHPVAMQVKANLERTPGRKVSGIEIEKTAFEIPAYPDNRVVPAATALAYRYADGKQVSLRAGVRWDGASGRAVLVLGPVGLTAPSYRFGYFKHQRGEPVTLDGELRGNEFLFRLPTGNTPAYLVVWVRDPALGDEEVLFAGPMLY